MFGPSPRVGGYYGLCWLLSGHDENPFPPRYAAVPFVACSLVRGWQLAATPGPCSSSSARSGLTVQPCIATPDRSPQVRTRCFRAQALHLPCPPYPMGFVMRCQLARRPGLLCNFCPSPRTLALRRPGHSQSSWRSGGWKRSSSLSETPPSPSGQALAGLPLPSA